MRSAGAVAFLKLGLEQSECALRLGVSEGLVAMWRSGQRVPGFTNRKRIETVYKIAPELWDKGPEPIVVVPEKPAIEVPKRIGVDEAERLIDNIAERIRSDPGMTPKEQARALRELISAMALVKKLRGEDASEMQVLRHPKWAKLAEALLDLLEEHPAALADFKAWLVEQERRSA